ncbi:MAG TPA: hypothetical protein VM364_18880 [Vicinamibacterales bacterium]|nr:hypothetical protein [Vicinamibacterales bacterium]
MPLNIRASIATLALVSIATAACGRDTRGDNDQQVPVPQATTETATPLDRPTRVVGCVRAGEAANTYVLTTSLTEGVMAPATYHLAGAANVNLQEYVGKQVEVNGRLTSQQQMTTRDVRPSTAERAEGTSGRPTVETGTSLAVRHLEVSEIRPLADECEQRKQ